MRKMMTVAIAIALLFTTVAFADDLSAMTDAELLALYQNVLDEMNRRWTPEEPKTDSELADPSDCVMSFFEAWSQNDLDEMLTLCDSGWKATVEDPRTALFALLANSTPFDVSIESVQEIAGEGPEGRTYDLVTVTTLLKRNDGLPLKRYLIQFLVGKEEDGRWSVNPSGLETREPAEEAFPAEEKPEIDAENAASDLVLYYQPTGGEYYHLDPNCRRVNPKYLPLQGSFLYAELNNEPYRDLIPCEICGAPSRQEAGNLRTYREMPDGTWMCDGYTYQYRLEISGRMPNAAVDSTFVYLSNLEEISFEQAYLAAGLSSNLEDYFSPEEAVLVEMR